jgi:hypothetical protein
MADNDEGPPFETCKATEDRLIIGKRTVTRQRHEIIEQSIDEVAEMGTLWMPREQPTLPRRQPRVEINKLALRPLVKHRGIAFAPSRFAQRDRTCRQRLDRFLKRQILHHTVIDMPR